MDFKEAILILNNQSVTAYEIHKETGLNEAGVRRILNNEVEKPQRKTQEAIVKYAIAIQNNTNNNIDFSLKDCADMVAKNYKKAKEVSKLLELTINNDNRDYLIAYLESKGFKVNS